MSRLRFSLNNAIGPSAGCHSDPLRDPIYVALGLLYVYVGLLLYCTYLAKAHDI